MKFRLFHIMLRSATPLEKEYPENMLLKDVLKDLKSEERIDFLGCESFIVYNFQDRSLLRRLSSLDIPIHEVLLAPEEVLVVGVKPRNIH